MSLQEDPLDTATWQIQVPCNMHSTEGITIGHLLCLQLCQVLDHGCGRLGPTWMFYVEDSTQICWNYPFQMICATCQVDISSNRNCVSIAYDAHILSADWCVWLGLICIHWQYQRPGPTEFRGRNWILLSRSRGSSADPTNKIQLVKFYECHECQIIDGCCWLPQQPHNSL